MLQRKRFTTIYLDVEGFMLLLTNFLIRDLSLSKAFGQKNHATTDFLVTISSSTLIPLNKVSLSIIVLKTE